MKTRLYPLSRLSVGAVGAIGASSAASLALLLIACASDTPASIEDPPASAPLPDGAPADGGADGAAAPCDDCEHFPETCGEGMLCAHDIFTPNGENGLDMRAQLNVVRGRSPSDVWAIGALGAAAHFDGTSWTRSDVGRRETLRALWLRSSGEIVFGTLENIYTRGVTIDDPDASAPSPGGWSARGSATPAPDYNPAQVHVTSAWSAPDSDWLWCGTTTWNAGTTSGLWRLHISSSGEPEMATGIPPALCTDLPCSQVTDIHGSTADDLWAVGYRGAAVRVTGANGDSPTMKVSDTQTWDALYGVWMASASEAWAVGANGTIRHSKGNSLVWDIVEDVPTTEDLHAVWGASPSDIWAVGNKGIALHYDGATWSRVKIAGLEGRRPNLTTVWMPGPGHVWIGGQGVILSLGGKP